MTIGAMIEPSNIPNLNHSLFGKANTLGATKASKKKTADIVNAQIRKPSELVKGYKATTKNTIENTMPKDFGEDLFTEVDINTYFDNTKFFNNSL